jgi:hypothetical protein
MTELEPLHIRRLLVALDAARTAAVDWDAAMDLAALIGAELQGLIVENADLLGLAALPVVNEVGRLSGQSRPLERGSVESILRRRIERTVAALEHAAKRRNVAVSHITARGRLVRQALEQGGPGDVLFLSPAAVSNLGARVEREHGRGRAPGPILLWYDAGPAAAQSCELALYLARRTGAGLVVSFPCELFATEAELRAQLGAALEKAPGPIRFNALAHARMDLLLETARAARIARIVLSAHGPLVSAESLEYLCGAFRGDLILVR